MLPLLDVLAAENAPSVASLSIGPKILGKHLVVLADPEAIAEFTSQPNSFVRSKSEQAKFSKLLSPLCAIALSEGDIWRKHTKTMTKFYHARNLERVVDAFERHVDTFLEALADGGRPFMELMNQLSLDIILDVAFSRKTKSPKLVGAVKQIFGALKDAVFTEGHKLQVPPSHYEALDIVRVFVADCLRERLTLKQEEWPADFLSLFASHMGDNCGENSSTGFSIEEIVGELSMVLLAGMETTAHTLGFLVQHLAENQGAQEKLRAEIDDTLGRFLVPSYADVHDMPYLKSCLEESQRLDPVAIWVSRVVTNDMKIGHFEIPTGTTVIINNYTMSRRERLFSEPLKFRPERWLERERGASSLDHVPFGIGLRSCQGKQLARTEICYILSRILQRFEIQTTGETFRKTINFTLTPHTTVRFIQREFEINGERIEEDIDLKVSV